MNLDFPGRLKNVNLPASRALLPVFEAIVNSIHAIEDAHAKNGTITVTITRDSTPDLLASDKGVGDITSFTVTDNGIGFTDDNLSAFKTSDTTYKAARGGKGIGRFVWLVAFESVSIASTFKDDEEWKTRAFNFVPKDKGVADENTTPTARRKRETTVRLAGFKEPYRSAAPKRTATIGAHIVEHCLEYLIRPNPPHVVLRDEATDDSIDLNEVFEKEMAANSQSVKFKVGVFDFELLHVRLYSTHIHDHLLHYCANSRAVRSEKLLGRIPNLAKKLIDDHGREFVYASYLDSNLLDTTANQERTDFSLSADEEGVFPALNEIREAAIGQAKTYLVPYTKPVQRKKDKRIDEFVETEGPMYRPILKHVQAEIGMIDPDVSDDELDLKLYKAYHDLQVRLRVEGQELMRAQDATTGEFEQYSTQFSEYFSTVSDVHKADLARYVFHRRLVLDFLHKLLGLQEDGTYALEKRVHQLIFPMGETSADVLPDQHNLWLLDERLAYHKFLASDKQLRILDPLANGSAKEPDIIVFDKACAFVTDPDGPFQSITIIEFKRPKRTTYTYKENPIGQIREYIKEIRAGRAVTEQGHPVPVANGVHFYCYIVADKADQLDDFARGSQLDPTPDSQGHFGFLKYETAYVEIMTYRQMLTNAKQRNAAFFNRLGLPTCIPSTEPSTTNSDADP